ncbi:ImmA/IrrE family metallo-endopeptidase [Streptomonospora sp. S1-112]|uniref:ImmA/IrrE family metallo-endopeptidase n=1 Tax=Streptomonospora mangrovi TaxID=2883123 RepID=A0A9X3SJT7_9ACTN|nr:ImmA/IrrE family metallo-endopeptidase [Streptomonospora mangrovi]MDA0567719.1 ImmA/IrrE family metallo-endopeptidase [Streptomonospora mangrovi]
MVTPSRIQLARERRAVTLAQLSRTCGISQQSLSRYENARAEPSAETLAAIAAALRFPVAFFTAEDIEEVGSEAVAFRARTKTSMRKQKAVRASAALGVQLHHWLAERFALPEPDVPTLGRPAPDVAAEIVRSRWGLGEAAAPNMVHLLEAHGVCVFSLDPEHEEVDAFSFWRDSTPYVFLSTGKTAERGRFDAAHELGHLVMHGQERPLTGPDAEREANQFASAFLMPRADVLARMPAGAQVDQILKARTIWRVSAMALTYRMHDLGLLTDWQYRSTCAQLAELGYRRGEPDGIPRETSQVLTKAFQRLRRTGTPAAQVAADLHIPLEELNTLMFGLAFTARDGAAEPGTPTGRRARLRVL